MIKDRVYPTTKKKQRKHYKTQWIQDSFNGPRYLGDGRCGPCFLCWLSCSSCPLTESIHLAQPPTSVSLYIPLGELIRSGSNALPEPEISSPSPRHLIHISVCHLNVTPSPLTQYIKSWSSLPPNLTVSDAVLLVTQVCNLGISASNWNGCWKTKASLTCLLFPPSLPTPEATFFIIISGKSSFDPTLLSCYFSAQTCLYPAELFCIVTEATMIRFHPICSNLFPIIL